MSAGLEIEAEPVGAVVAPVVSGTETAIRVEGLVKTYDGVEAFPGIWDKAYALLHGLSSTQGFVDGNKRTVWDAMELFLTVNGIFLAIRPIEADVFVRAVALNAIEQELAIEWLQAHRRRD